MRARPSRLAAGGGHPGRDTQAASTPAARAPAARHGRRGRERRGGGDGLAADAAQLPIEELNLPVRSFNSLRREGVHTVGGLAARTEKELLAIDGLGPQSIKEIKAGSPTTGWLSPPPA